MEILDIRILKGPNYWSVNHKIAEITLDTGPYKELFTDKIDGFYETLILLLPGLRDHFCSTGKPGEFLERVKEGTGIGHLVEHIAIEIQSKAGMKVNFGKTVPLDSSGIFKISFEYEEERAAIYASHASVRIAEALFNSQYYDVNIDITALRKIASEDRLNFSTSIIVKCALAKNIPVIRYDSGLFVQLGYGSAQKRIGGAITDNTSSIAVELSTDKHKTKSLLKEAAVDVSEGFLITYSSELEQAVNILGFPIVIKPNDSNQGKGITVNISDYNHALKGFHKAKVYSDSILVERFYSGKDYRLLIVNYKFVAAIQRLPAQVIGNGILKESELHDIVNPDLLKGEDKENKPTKVKTDSSAEEFLRVQDLTFDSVPQAGKKVFQKHTMNSGSGILAEDVTDTVHPEIISMAERVSRIIGLDICGIDYISEDIALPLKIGKGVVIEVNATPGIWIHTNPFKGKSRNVENAIVEMMFPKENNGRIPLIAVTGTNGKTTTTHLIAHMAKTAGYNVGFASSDGIYIGNERIREGDSTDLLSAQKILREKSVNFAVLECSRDGLLNSGLGFDHCDAGVVTNVTDDYLGLKGINTLEEMALVKAVIPETVKPGGLAILNADNPITCNMKDDLKCKIAFFSTNLSNTVLKHCKEGGIAAIYQDKRVMLIKGNTIFLNEGIYKIPLAFGGKASFMVENILAAILAAWSVGIATDNIKKALRSFIPSFENLPGRMNLFRFNKFQFILDRGHNFHEISLLGSLFKLSNISCKVGIISSPGNCRDLDLMNIGKASAGVFDKIIIRVDEDTQGRSDTEIIDLLQTGIRSINKDLPVEIIKDEMEAVNSAVLHAIPGSIIVLFSERINKSYEVITKFKNKEAEEINEQVLKSS